MKLLTATLIVASALAVVAATPSHEAQGDLSLRVIFADEASGFIAATVAPAPSILLDSVSGPAPMAGAVLACKMNDATDTLECYDGKSTLTLRPRGFVLTAQPPDTWVRGPHSPAAITN